MQVTDAMVDAARKIIWGRDHNHLHGDDLISAALTAALAEMWRPIEGAPKDGTEILIAGGTFYNSMSTFTDDLPFNGTALVRWDDYCREWRGENSGGHDEYFWYKPTAWQPLPVPPPRGK